MNKSYESTKNRYHRLFSLAGKVLAYLLGGLGSTPSLTNTQGSKATEKKKLPLLLHLLMIRPSKVRKLKCRTSRLNLNHWT